MNDARTVDGCATLGLRAGFLQRNLGKGQNRRAKGNVYRTEVVWSSRKNGRVCWIY